MLLHHTVSTRGTDECDNSGRERDEKEQICKVNPHRIFQRNLKLSKLRFMENLFKYNY